LYEFLDYTVADAMTREPVTIAPDLPLGEAAALLERHDFNALPVVEGAGRLLGVLSKLDVLRAFRFTPRSKLPPYDEIMAQPAREAMTTRPECMSPAEPLTRVLQHMVESGHKSFPVLDAGRLVGVVSREDVVRALRAAARGASAADLRNRRT
jgi:CBS domain-containing protein